MFHLAPGILIAAPPLGDPNFDRSVVLLASHDEQGAFGWVINGLAMLSIGELLEQMELKCDKSPTGLLDTVVRCGGPVGSGQVSLVYPDGGLKLSAASEMVIAPGICATSSREFLERLASGEGVRHLGAFAGYAGWAAGQLEKEILEGVWLPGTLSTELVFETKTDDIWNRAYELQGMTPLSFTSKIVGSA